MGGVTMSDEPRRSETEPRPRDPGDAVPPGVAVETPAPLSPEDEAVREKLERLKKDA
jgi:hypothetical protein